MTLTTILLQSQQAVADSLANLTKKFSTLPDSLANVTPQKIHEGIKNFNWNEVISQLTDTGVSLALHILAAVVVFLLTTSLGIVFTLSLGPLSHIKMGGLTLFDFIDRINSIYLPPLCALLTVIFLGWVMPESDVYDEFTNHGTVALRFYGVFRFIARYIAPLALLVVMVSGILM